MISVLRYLAGYVGIAAFVTLVSGAVQAQAPTSPPLDIKQRQPTPTSVQQLEQPQDTQDKNRTALEKKVREMDRRLNRTMRSVCVGC